MPQEDLTLILGLMASRMVAQEQGCPADLHNTSIRGLPWLGVTGCWEPADVGVTEIIYIDSARQEIFPLAITLLMS